MQSRLLLLRSYGRLREAVRHHCRVMEPSEEGLKSEFTWPRTADLAIIERVCKRLKALPNKRWGNVRKKHDKLFRLLPAVRFTSRQVADQGSLQVFLRESFRARAISGTSSRHQRGLARKFVPAASQRYALYGRKRLLELRSKKPKKSVAMQCQVFLDS